jgi:hypothetical protein
MSNIPDRATTRPPVKMRKQNCDRDADPQCGNCTRRYRVYWYKASS